MLYLKLRKGQYLDCIRDICIFIIAWGWMGPETRSGYHTCTDLNSERYLMSGDPLPYGSPSEREMGGGCLATGEGTWGIF